MKECTDVVLTRNLPSKLYHGNNNFHQCSSHHHHHHYHRHHHHHHRSWGFRLIGGRDEGLVLKVDKVCFYLKDNSILLIKHSSQSQLIFFRFLAWTHQPHSVDWRLEMFLSRFPFDFHAFIAYKTFAICQWHCSRRSALVVEMVWDTDIKSIDPMRNSHAVLPPALVVFFIFP